MLATARNLLLAVLIALVILAATVGLRLADETEAAQAGPGKVLFGMDVPSLNSLDASESALGARSAIVGTFVDWAHTPDFPRAMAEAINERGAVALISWEPWDWDGGAEQPRYSLRHITAGDHDALIDRWAKEIADYRRPVMLRFAPEMNGDWLPWSTGVNGNRGGDYVAAWRHVRARFRRAGADNAIWVWNPIASYESSTPLADVFPGSREVDWVALDGHNWGSVRDRGWQSYEEIFGPTLRTLRAIAPRRPVMIAETGSAPGPRKPLWVNDTLRRAVAGGVDAVVWFEFAKETDWRLAADRVSARAAGAALRDTHWRLGGDLAAVERLVRATAR